MRAETEKNGIFGAEKKAAFPVPRKKAVAVPKTALSARQNSVVDTAVPEEKMKNDVPQAVQAVTEKAFQATLMEYAQLLRWTVYHTYDSRRSAPGYPDLTLVRGERLLFVELKTDRGRLTAAQRAWLVALGRTAAEVYLWRPGDWDEIAAVLS